MNRARFLVVLDVDSTLIENEIIDMLAEHAGTLDIVSDITKRAMRGELDFEESLRQRVATLVGLSTDCFAQVAKNITLTQGAEDLVKTVQQTGSVVGIISGGFHEVVDTVAASLGVALTRANRLETRDGKLTGRLFGAVVDAREKAETLKKWANTHEISRYRSIAVGDGSNDIEMFEAAGLSLAFAAQENVRAAANISLPIRDLRQLLPILGLGFGVNSQVNAPFPDHRQQE